MAFIFGRFTLTHILTYFNTSHYLSLPLSHSEPPDVDTCSSSGIKWAQGIVKMKRLQTMSDWLSVSTDINIGELRDYLNTLNSYILPLADDFQKKIESEANTIQDEDERQEFYEFHSDVYWKYKETFPRILFNTFHVAAYTLLESEFNSVATRIGVKQNQVFDVSDIKGNDYLQSASIYIKKTANIDSKTFPAWTDLQEARRLRNIIVHSNGRLRSDADIQIATKHNVLSRSGISIKDLAPHSEITITFDYAKTFLAAMRVFFKNLYKETKAGHVL